ncbi:alpha/beta fold hydrolase [Litoribacter ruber]|uniref:Alpha/beta fold hydrolase n=1 Tax=Litoribacter ruber TaxID=702568 RepID=A0AAP2CGN4_9BACT|nr:MULTISPECIES: alpha/beta fold hydrolase [Litoribacter]MBS9524323.1 alpha/beta fold hydrolase [Litoribacter alkaliphilus]MBT0809877.1 alpha/beta fold hydrolase [Litoribacter ruber]
MKLNYKKIGQGKPLIILHGLFGSADNWLTIARDLEKEYTLYLVDQRNHGDSPHSEEWNYTAMAQDIAELMESEGLDSAFLMGHSMGGKTVMNFAMLYPEKVDKLIVADIAPRYYPVHHERILEGLNAVDLQNAKSRKDADDMLAKYINSAPIRQFLMKNLTRKDGGFAWKINLQTITKNIEEVGKALESDNTFDKPTLFMGGANSDYITEKDREDIERFFPNSHIIHLKNAGHWLHAEQPEAVSRTIRAFLEKE